MPYREAVFRSREMKDEPLVICSIVVHCDFDPWVRKVGRVLVAVADILPTVGVTMWRCGRVERCIIP